MKDTTIANRIRTVFPDAVPWRERRLTEALASVLDQHGATDAEAADVFACEAARARDEMRRYIERHAAPMAFQLPSREAAHTAVLVERERIASLLARALHLGEQGRADLLRAFSAE